jgi:beta-xylosidase
LQLLFSIAVLVLAAPPPRDFADPFVLRAGDTYYAFATNSGHVNVQVERSTDLKTWTPLPDALPQLPPWAQRAAGLTWAPSVLPRGNGYVLFYTAREVRSGVQCISRATSQQPQGPYTDDSSEPFVCQRALCGSIDPSPFVDSDGRAYLLWKSDENGAACRSAPRLWAQELGTDGLSLRGAPAPLLVKDAGWEGALIEGPSMVRSGPGTVLFYSANAYDSAQYAVGYARCKGPLGPCEKVTRMTPLLASVGLMLGPGGQELFTDVAGKLWMAFHAWTQPHTAYPSGARSLRLAQVELGDSGDVKIHVAQ